METLTEDQKKIVMAQLRTELLKAALKLYIRECRAAGMSVDEIKAELKRAWLRMQNLTEEGFTIEQAEEIILKEEDAER